MNPLKTLAIIASLALAYINCMAQEYPTVYCHTSGEWSSWNFTTDRNDKTQHINIGGCSSEIADYVVVVPSGVTLEMGQASNGCRAREIIVEQGGKLEITNYTCQTEKLTINGELYLHSNETNYTQMDKYMGYYPSSGDLYVEGNGKLTIPNRDMFKFSDDSPILTNGIVREFMPKQYNGYRFFSCDNGNWNDGNIWSLYDNIRVLFYDIDNDTYHHSGDISDIRQEIVIHENNEIWLEGNTSVGSIFIYGKLHICGSDGTNASINCTDQWAAGGVHEGVMEISQTGTLDICSNASIEVPLGTVVINGTIEGEGNINGHKIDTTNGANIDNYTGQATETVDRQYWDYFNNGEATFVATENGKWNDILWGWESPSGLIIRNQNIQQPFDNQGVTVIIPKDITVNQITGRTENLKTIIDGTLDMCDEGMWEATQQWGGETMVEVNGILAICENSSVKINGTLVVNENGKVINYGQIDYTKVENKGFIDDYDLRKAFRTINDGNWNSASTWVAPNGRQIPGAGDIAIINHNVALSAATEIKWLIIENGGTLTTSNSGTMKVTYMADVKDEGRMVINAPLELSGNSEMRVLPGSMIEVYSTINTNRDGQITISNSSDLSASFYTGNGCTLKNKVRVERGLKPNRGYTAGSATKEGTIDSGLTSGDIFQYYDAYNYEYYPSTNFGGTFKTGQMYLPYNGTTERILTQVGTIEQGDKEYTLRTADGETYGWNLIQNPFTTAIGIADDGKELFQYDDGADPVIWFYTLMGDSYKFITYSLSADVEVPLNSSGRWADNIAPQQGFFIKTTKDNVKFTVKYPKKAIARTGLKSAMAGPTDVLRLALSSDGSDTDEMALVFRDGGSLSHIEADADKQWESETNNQIYGIKGNYGYAITMYPDASEMTETEVPVGILTSTVSSGKYTISALNIDDFKAAENVTLIDKRLNQRINLREDSYSFTMTAGADDDDRFRIELSGNKMTDDDIVTGIDNTKAKGISITETTYGVSIDIADRSEAQVRVIDITGREICSQQIAQQKSNVNFNAHGICIVEVTSDGETIRKKILK